MPCRRAPRAGASGSISSVCTCGLSLLRDADALETVELDGVAAEELVDLVVGQPGLLADAPRRVLRVRERRVGVRIVGLEADLVHPDDVTVGEGRLVVQDAAVDAAGVVRRRRPLPASPERGAGSTLPQHFGGHG